MPQPDSLDLSASRLISFRDNGFTYSYAFDRIATTDWNKYFESIVATSERGAQAEKTMLDALTGACALVRSKVVSADGYAEGFGDRKGWRDALPVRHIRLVASLLLSVQVDNSSPSPIDPFHQEVRLRCPWTSDTPGEMKLYTGLVHRFAPITADRERQFNRYAGQTLMMGNKTAFPSRQKAFLSLYDELIESVGGYRVPTISIDGDATNECCSSRRDIIREMDAMHKVAAIAELFAPVNEDAN